MTSDEDRVRGQPVSTAAPATSAAAFEPRGALPRRERGGMDVGRALAALAGVLAIFGIAFFALLLGGVRPYLGGFLAGVIAVLLVVLAGLFRSRGALQAWLERPRGTERVEAPAAP